VTCCQTPWSGSPEPQPTLLGLDTVQYVTCKTSNIFTDAHWLRGHVSYDQKRILPSLAAVDHMPFDCDSPHAVPP
jgi:hypothetical protein